MDTDIRFGFLYPELAGFVDLNVSFASGNGGVLARVEFLKVNETFVEYILPQFGRGGGAKGIADDLLFATAKISHVVVFEKQGTTQSEG